jgi:hypothetical protein
MASLVRGRSRRSRAVPRPAATLTIRAGQPRRGELVIGFGNVTEEAIERGIAAIADLLQPPARRSASRSRRPAERRTRAR